MLSKTQAAPSLPLIHGRLTWHFNPTVPARSRLCAFHSIPGPPSKSYAATESKQLQPRQTRRRSRDLRWGYRPFRQGFHAAINGEHNSKERRGGPDWSKPSDFSGNSLDASPVGDGYRLINGEKISEIRSPDDQSRAVTRPLVSGIVLAGGAVLLPLLARILSPLIIAGGSEQVDTVITGESESSTFSHVNLRGYYRLSIQSLLTSLYFTITKVGLCPWLASCLRCFPVLA